MEFTRVTPESQGIPSKAIGEMLDAIYAAGGEMHGFMLLRHGKLVASGAWDPCRLTEPQAIYSFSKSFTSTAIGFLIQEGKLRLDEKMTEIFPELMPAEVTPNLAECTVEHLLTMSCGHESEVESFTLRDSAGQEWIRRFFAHPFVYAPGTHFVYNTVGTNVLSAVVTRRTGQPLTEYLRPRLLEPLGFTGSFSCSKNPDGVSEAGGAGVRACLCDLAKFIQFIADGGKWNGVQLLDPQWIRMAGSARVNNSNWGTGSDDWSVGYGFQFWQCIPDGVFRADGAYGQYGIVFGKEDAVLVIQSVTTTMGRTLEAIWRTLLPAMQEAPLPEDPVAQAILEDRLTRLRLPAPMPRRDMETEAKVKGRIYHIADGEGVNLPEMLKFYPALPENRPVKSLQFDFGESSVALTLTGDSGTMTVEAGLTGNYCRTPYGDTVLAAAAGWTGAGQLEIALRDLQMVCGVRLIASFDKAEEGTLTMRIEPGIPEENGIIGIGVAKSIWKV